MYTVLSTVPRGPVAVDDVARIVVLPDVHGDLHKARGALRLAGVIDERDRWIARDTVVVQLGDQIDGKPRQAPAQQAQSREKTHGHECGESIRHDLEVLGFFNALHQGATRSGGAAFSLLGNHEMMNVRGVFGYVDDDGCARCAAMRRETFSPGRFGARLLACTRAAALRVGPLLFCHAGVLRWHLDACDDDIFELNRAVFRYFMGYELSDMQTRILDNVLLHPEGPLTTRAYAPWQAGAEQRGGSDYNGGRAASPAEDELPGLLSRLGVTRMIIGHNAHDPGLTAVFGGGVLVFDPGMSRSVLDAPAAALELRAADGWRPRLVTLET